MAAGLTAGIVAASSPSFAAAEKKLGAPGKMAGRPPVIDFRVRPPFKSFRRMVSNEILPLPPGASDAVAMKAFIGEMDAGGVDKAVAMGRTAPGPGPIQMTIPNDDVAELVATYPDKFIGFGSVDVRDPAAAIKEVDRCARLGLRGIAFDNPLSAPALHNDDPSLMAIYERCVQNGLIIAINSSAMIGPDISYSDPVHIQRVAKRFPTHPIVATHACWPNAAKMISIVMAGLMLGESNIYYQPDYALLTGIPGGQEYLDAANISYVEVYKKILFGTSFPFVKPAEGVKRIRAHAFDNAAAKDHILGINAATILKL